MKEKYLWIGLVLSLAFLFAAVGLLIRFLVLPSVEQSVTTLPMVTQPTPSPLPSPSPSPVTIAFVGDLQFDRHIRKNAQERGGYDFILTDVAPVLRSADLVVGNLEGPVTDFPSRSLGSEVGSTNNFLFTFDPAVLPALKNSGNWLVNLGNNHILNFGDQGLAQTYAKLDAASIPYFGHAQPDQQFADEIFVWEQSGLRFLFVNYNQFILTDMELLLENIALQDPHFDYIILYTHWGNEYQTTASGVIVDQAHDFIEAGVDVLIGSHPHVIQQSEVYQGKTIYYSLGNFVFDQYFQPEVREGVIVTITVDPATGELSFSEQKVVLKPTGETVLIP